MFSKPETIDGVFRKFHGSDLLTLKAHTASLPAFRFVDLYQAIERLAEGWDDKRKVESQQHETLENLFHLPGPHQHPRLLDRVQRQSWAISPEEDAFLATDSFWMATDPENGPLVLRLRYLQYSETAELSVAARTSDAGKRISDRIIKDSGEHSIYRNEVLTLSYESGKRDEYGDVEKPEKLSVGFSPLAPVEESQIVLSERQIQLLKRNMIDLNTRRDVLRANNIPAKRGILMHGPPGTGKTYACRYLCNQMRDVTRIFLTGTALGNVTGVFALARLLQPAVVFIEDADLMFTSREVNLYSTSLGELMDQLDGLRGNEDISLVMTTNAIERLEAALKDRPGRISQCIYMGAPKADLRERFLSHQLDGVDMAEVDLDRLVRESAGATQAFLKEWVFRGLQIASERLDTPAPVCPTTEDFMEGLAEMQAERDDASGRIIGFQRADAISD